MKILAKVTGLFLLVFSLSGGLCAAETLTLSTYYPAPAGRYDEMRANRMAVGASYVDATVTVPADSLIVSGNLGVGIDVPIGLQVNVPTDETAQADSNVRVGVFNATPRIVFDQAGTGNSQWEIDSSSGKMRFYQPGVEKMVILGNGNVGIGSSIPAGKLSIFGTGDVRTRIDSSSTAAGAHAGYGIYGAGAFKGGLFIQNDDKTKIVLWNNTSPVLTADANNRVKINYTLCIPTGAPASPVDGDIWIQ